MKLIGSLTAVMMMVSAASAVGQSAKTAHEFEFTSIEGASLPMETFKGKTVLVVNTASRCGFTHQYADLQSVSKRYQERGLVVLGVPSNDFGGQEPGNESKIKEFCEVNFNVNFPMTSKVHVKGQDAHPFYRWAVQELGSDRKADRQRTNLHTGQRAATRTPRDTRRDLCRW